MLRPSHSCRLDNPNVIWWGYQFWSFSLCTFLQYPVTFSLLALNIVLSTLLSNILSFYSSLNVIDKVPHPYQTTSKIVVCIFLIFIQGVSRLVDITAGGDFLGLCDQKSSYKHVSDFGRLRSYGHFLIPVHALVWTASYGTSWGGDVLNLVAYRLRCIIFATWLADAATDSPVSVSRHL